MLRRQSQRLFLPRRIGSAFRALCAAGSLTALGLAGLVPAPAAGGTVVLPPVLGGPASIKVISLKEARFQTIIKQQFDFSCGSAALASLLTFHYDDPVTEIEIFREMYDSGDQARIQTYGFSLLDMKRYLERRGYRADGFKLDLDRLARAGIPALVLINTNGYKHFVLIKGIHGDEVVVGDPALGVRLLERSKFESMWNGIAFVIRSDVKLGREHFNLARDWGVRKKAPFGNALNSQSLASFTVHMTNLTNSF